MHVYLFVWGLWEGGRLCIPGYWRWQRNHHYTNNSQVILRLTNITTLSRREMLSIFLFCFLYTRHQHPLLKLSEMSVWAWNTFVSPFHPFYHLGGFFVRWCTVTIILSPCCTIPFFNRKQHIDSPICGL